MNFIDSLSATVEHLTGLIRRLECFIGQMMNLTVGEIHNALDSIQNQISDFHQEGLAIMSSFDPGSLRYTPGYWTRGGLQRRWISYRGRSKRGGRWHRGWGQRRYTWRPHNYQQEHNYSRLSHNDAVTINVRRANVLMLMPSTQDAVMEILPLVQPVTWSTTAEPAEPLISDTSAPQPAFAEASVPQPEFAEPSAPQPEFALPSRAQLYVTDSPWSQPRIAIPSARLFSQRPRAQPFLTRYSTGRPLFARRLAHVIYRPQPVRLYVDQPSTLEEPNRLVYEPFPIQSSRVRAMSTNSHSGIPSSTVAHNYSVLGGPVAPEQVAPGPMVPEAEQVVPILLEPEQLVPFPIITDPPNETI